MWRSSSRRSITMAFTHRNLHFLYPQPRHTMFSASRTSSRDESGEEKRATASENGEAEISLEEVKKLLNLVNVEALKTKLGEEGREMIGYSELLETCQSIGVARSVDEAASFAKVLDDAGFVLLFRDKVYLHPHKVVELVRRSVPLALISEDDPRRDEMHRLEERKKEIDEKAHRQVRLMLWSGLGFAMSQVGLFFRLTFWEFGWDVMGPITFFATATSLVIGYVYFFITSKNPTYRDLMTTLFLSRQRKLFKKYRFDADRFKELMDKCKYPF